MMRGGLVWCWLLLLFAGHAHAQSLQALIDAGELEARVVVETEAPLYQKAPIVIAVEVGTPHRFEGGLRVRDFKVPGALVRPVSKFPLNETRRRGGDSWAFQILRFRIYAERAGAVSTPDLHIAFSVETETQGIAQGELTLEVPVLQVEAPPGIEGLDAWVAAAGFEVEESWEGVLERYQVGDAVTRVRRFVIKEAPAMVIPASPSIELEGIQVYEAPAWLDDKAVGTKLTGVREERVVFTIKNGGSVTIPGQQIHWFNLETQSVERIDLASRTLEVEGSSAASSSSSADSESRGVRRVLPYSLCVILVGASGYWLVRRLGRTAAYYQLRQHLERWRENRRLRADFMRAAAQQDSRRCLTLLYARMAEHGQWQLSLVCGGDSQLMAVSTALMAHAYGDGAAPEPAELKGLWEMCAGPKKLRDKRAPLGLNPLPRT